MIKGKRGLEILQQNIIFLVLNLFFLGILIVFLSSRMGNSAVYEETYAKQIALVLDSAKPGMIIHINMEDGIDIAKKELGEDKLGEIVSIKENVVTVKLKEKGGYSYSFFNNIKVNSYIDVTNNKEFVFVIDSIK
jgi:hypothetical protein